MRKRKIIGVLGGMGPQASSRFYSYLISKSIYDYGVKNNNEFPEILLDSIPVPDFISDTESMKIAEEMLIDRVKRLSSYPVDILCIACNTAHILLPKLKLFTRTPFISIVDEVHNEIKLNKFKKVGLLSSMTTYNEGLYQKEGQGFELIYPKIKMRLLLEKSIRQVIAGEDEENIAKDIYPELDKYITQNQLEAVIIGCTELSVIFGQDRSVPRIDSLGVLANAVLKRYYNSAKKS